MTACLHWPTMRKHFAAATQAVRPLSDKPVRPWSGAMGSSWLLLGVLLTGLFAMHGLGDHGTHTANAEKTMPVPMSMLEAAPAAAVKDDDPDGPTPAAAHDGARTAAATSTSTPSRSSAAGGHVMADSSSTAPQRLTDLLDVGRLDRNVDGGVPGKEPGPGGLLGLCFAVLTAFMAWALAGGQALRGVPLVPCANAVAVPRGRGRDPDPPSRLMLSIHRC